MCFLTREFLIRPFAGPIPKIKKESLVDCNLSYDTRKALCVHLGEPAGKEVAELLMRLSRRVEHVERNKVSVTTIVPGQPIGHSVSPRSAV